MKQTSYQTDFDSGAVEELVWRLQLADHYEDLCYLTDAPADFIEGLVADPTGKAIPITIRHDHFSDFEAVFTVMGLLSKQVWGVVESSAPVALSVKERYQYANVIEDEGVLSMISPDFNNLACLQPRPNDRARLTILSSREDLEPNLDTLNLLTFVGK